MASTTIFNRVIGKVVQLEGGHSTNENDPGNWTGGKIGSGILKGTKYGISAASYPGLDIANLTKDKAIGLYYRDYWLAEGCDKMPAPLAFLHFDATIQHGASNSRHFLREANGNAWAYFGVRLEFYASREQFYQEDGDPTNDFGRGWVNRMAGVAEEMATLGLPGDEPLKADKLVDNRNIVTRVVAAVNGVSGPIKYRVRPLASGEGVKLDVSS